VNNRFIQECANLAARFGYPGARVLLTNNIHQQNALACGILGCRYILVGGGLRVVAAREPKRFQATIAHEASHLLHGDVDFTYLGIAAANGLAFVFCLGLLVYVYKFCLRLKMSMLLPFFGPWLQVHGLSDFVATFGVWFLWLVIPLLIELTMVAGLFMVVAFEYRALLRNREYHADVHAASRVGAEALIDALRAGRSRDNIPGRFVAFRRHPTQLQREEVVKHPHHLLRTSHTQALIAGFTAGQIIVQASVLRNIDPLSTSAMESLSTYMHDLSVNHMHFVLHSLLVIAFGASLSVIASQNLRRITSYVLGYESVMASVVSIFSSVCGSIIGLSLATLFNEETLAGLIREGVLSPAVINDKFSFAKVLLSLGLAMLFTNCCFYVFLGGMGRRNNWQDNKSDVFGKIRVISILIWIMLTFYSWQSIASVAVFNEFSIALCVLQVIVISPLLIIACVNSIFRHRAAVAKKSVEGTM